MPSAASNAVDGDARTPQWWAFPNQSRLSTPGAAVLRKYQGESSASRPVSRAPAPLATATSQGYLLQPSLAALPRVAALPKVASLPRVTSKDPSLRLQAHTHTEDSLKWATYMIQVQFAAHRQQRSAERLATVVAAMQEQHLSHLEAKREFAPRRLVGSDRQVERATRVSLVGTRSPLPQQPTIKQEPKRRLPKLSPAHQQGYWYSSPAAYEHLERIYQPVHQTSKVRKLASPNALPKSWSQTRLASGSWVPTRGASPEELRSRPASRGETAGLI